MKIRMRLFALIAVMMVSTSETVSGEELRMMVVSDTHVMNPQLLREEGKAFADYIAHDRKMLKESSLLMEEMTVEILRRRPQVVLITGDLTKDGETISHTFLRDNYLRRMRDAGIMVLVIPGNHDVDNPHAVEFLGDSTRRVATPKVEEFAKIYDDYGYGAAMVRDAHSLSYVSQLNDSVRIICLDACKYEENDYDNNVCVTGGRLKPETIEFIKEQARDAREHGIRLLAMIHHGVVEHWKWQSKAMGDYLVDDWKELSKMLSKLGIEIVFTGHFHSQDIAERNGLYDIETGSLVSYPSPYRMVNLIGNKLIIETEHLKGTEITGLGQDIGDYSEGYARSGIHTIVSEMLPSKISGDVRNEASDVVGDAYVAHLAGDETLSDDNAEQIKRVGKKVGKYSWKFGYIFKHVARYMWTDDMPQDNNIEITLKNKTDEK